MVRLYGEIVFLGREDLQTSIYKCPGVPRGHLQGWPLIAADKCIICPFIHTQAIELLQLQSPPQTRDLSSWKQSFANLRFKDLNLDC